jgi:hypothetical protein
VAAVVAAAAVVVGGAVAVEVAGVDQQRLGRQTLADWCR